MKFITLKLLKKLNACEDARDAFEREFGAKAEVTPEKLIEATRKLECSNWEGWLLGQNVPLTELILKHGADVHASNDYALRFAARNGHTKVVELLLKHGADVHAHYDEALHEAVYYGHTEVVELLKKAAA